MFSIVISIYFVETISHLSFFKSHKALLIKQENKKNNEKKFENNKYNKLDTNFVSPDNFLYPDSKIIPLSGISNLKTIFCNENRYYANYKSDKYGFRNQDDIWDQEVIDYLLLGDSFVHGACVMNKDTISEIIRKKTQSNVLNLGMSGNGPIRNLAVMREYILKKKIKKLLYFHYAGNDWEDIIIEKSNPILINYLKDINFTQDLIKKTKKLDELRFKKLKDSKKLFLNKQNKRRYEKTIQNQKTIFKIIKLQNIRKKLRGKISEYKNFKFHKIPNKENQILFYSILKEILNISSKNETEFYFIYIPDKNIYDASEGSIRYSHFEKDLTLSIIKKMNIKYIDLYEEKKKIIIDPLKLISGHYNEIGYNVITNIVLNKIQ